MHSSIRAKPKEVQDKFLEVANTLIRKGSNTSYSIQEANKAIVQFEIDLEELELAKEYRDIFLRGGDTSDIDLFVSKMLTKFFSNNSSKCHVKKNIAEDTTAICFEERKNVNSCRWRVIWKEGKNKLSKSFSCYKLFPDLEKESAIEKKTFELAKEFRDLKLKEISENAA